jgi:hypothetical protein
MINNGVDDKRFQSVAIRPPQLVCGGARKAHKAQPQRSD